MLNITRAALLAKLEPNYGTDSVPAAATDAVLLAGEDGPIWELVEDAKERMTVRPYFGADAELPWQRYYRTSFQQELTGFGTAGPAAPIAGYDALLQACGLARTITADTRVDYTPISQGHKSASIYDYIDGLLAKLVGARGNLKLDITNGDIPLLTYEMLALYSAPTDTALVSPNVAAYKEPVVASPVNTTNFTLHGFGTACLESFSFDSGLDLSFRQPIGCTPQIFPKQRKSMGKVKIEMTTVAAKNWFAAVTDGAVGAVSITHGSVGGNKVVFSGNKVQLRNPKLSQTDKTLMLEMDLRFRPTNGNDDFTLSIQ